MNGMKIDFKVIRNWVEKWEKNDGVNKTASQIAAVMLNKVLEENERRIEKIECLMKDVLKETRLIQGMEQQLIARLKSKGGFDAAMEAELKEHRRRTAALLRRAEEVMKVPSADQSVLVGGLLLEINKQGTSASAAATTASAKAP